VDLVNKSKVMHVDRK